MPRRLILQILLAVMPAVSAAGRAPADDTPVYPLKPVRFIVGFTPGGPSDILARILGERLSAHWGQQVIVENRPGAGGNLAAEAAAHAPADGYTWLLANNSILATNPSLYAHPGFDPEKDFAPVALLATQPNVLVTNPELPARSVGELIALARQRPGQLNFASSGSGTAAHLAGELFKSMTGIDIVHIPYKGAQPALTDVLANHAQMMFATSASVLPYVKSGRLRALAVTSSARVAVLPETPTVAEEGVPGFEAVSWHGVVVPRGTPEQLIERLNHDIDATLRETQVRERLAGLGVEPAGGSAAQFAGYIRSETLKWTAIVKLSGAHAD